MSSELNNNSGDTQQIDNISADTSDIKTIAEQPNDLPELIPSDQKNDASPVVSQPPVTQKTEFEFSDLLVTGQEMCGENVRFKLEFDSQLVDGSKVVARKSTGEFMFSARMRYRNYGRVTDDRKTLVIPTFFTDLEKLEKLEIYVENNNEDKNKVESEK